jgi:signal transduction histidine kinase
MPRLRRAAATLIYVLTALPMGAVGWALVLGGWIVSLSLAVTPLVLIVPALLVAFRAAVGVVAYAEAWLARSLVGASVEPEPWRVGGGPGYWRRARIVLGDGAFYRQQAFGVLRFVLGQAAAIVELALIAGGLAALTLPITYRWMDSGDPPWPTQTLGHAMVGVPAGIIALVIAFSFLRPLEMVSCYLADGLLGGDDGASPPRPAASDDARAQRGDRRQTLAMAIVTTAGIGLLLIVIWAASGGQYFWPAWVIISLGVPLAFYGWLVLLDERPDLPARMHMSRGLAVHTGVAAALSLYLILVWALSGGSDFWPIFPMLALFATLVAHVVVDLNRSISGGPLAERITELETTRAGAVDQQEAELRRIERDLHDGAQARLVALGMSLGMAEQKLAADDPQAAQALLADARQGARDALVELRDLARGIHPPVLADRGLEAAIAALADGTPLRVRVTASLPERPAAAVETAAYFVVAESLANAAKHADATAVDIAIGRVGATLIVEIRDDGVGGADASGSGLTGLARRVQALDGTLDVSSPAGGPTRIRAVMPCGS